MGGDARRTWGVVQCLWDDRWPRDRHQVSSGGAGPGRPVLRLGWTCGGLQTRVQEAPGRGWVREGWSLAERDGPGLPPPRLGCGEPPAPLCPTPLGNVERLRTCASAWPAIPGPCSLEMER